MDYSSPGFIFFAIFGLIIFYALPVRIRTFYLLVLSFIWIYFWKPEWAILYFCILNFNYLVLTIARKLTRKAFCFYPLILIDLAIFLILKSELSPEQFRHPYGLSFFMFMIAGLIFDEWRGQSKEQSGWQEFTLMPVFFPFLMAGPIERGRHFLSELQGKRNLLTDLTDAVLLFSLGFFKIYVLMPALKSLFENFMAAPGALFSLIMIGFLGTFNIYIELSGYATMGRGVARAFGFDVPLSFRPIYYSKTPADFWARWNITLGTWIRDYFTFPMMLKFGRKIHPNLLVIFAFIIVGLWHAVELKWILFGLFNGLMIVSFNMIPRLGRLLALIIILGNGLILAEPNFANLELLKLDGLETFFLSSSFGIMSVLFLIATFLIELVEEKKNEQDWFLRFPLKGKLVLSSILFILFFWSLEADILTQQTGIQLPVYFKL